MKKIAILLVAALLSFNLKSQDCNCANGSSILTVTNGNNTIVNAYYPGNNSALSGATAITLGAERATGVNGTIASGDVLLVIQMQGVEIDATVPDDAANDVYGDGIGGNDRFGNLVTEDYIAGQYEYVIASSAVGSGGGILTLKTALVNSYLNQTSAASFSATQGRQTFQVIRVGNYTTVDIQVGGNVTGLPWNGATGGVIALDALTSIAINGTIDADFLGFRGGHRRDADSGGGGSGVSVFTSQTGIRGEGIAGTPLQVWGYDGAPLIAGALTGAVLAETGYPGGEDTSTPNPRGGNPNNVIFNSYRGAGAPGNAGGAGQGDNSGGGGSNGGFGGTGGGGTPGIGGDELSLEGATRAFLGGGGGSGGFDNDAGVYTEAVASGQPGGGIILLRANSISGAGTISNDGASGGTHDEEGAGGGGAGGTIIVVTDTEDLSTLTISSDGGDGGSTDNGGDAGAGGGSGGNILLVRRGGTFSGIPTVSVTGGVGGTSNGAASGGAGNGGFETTSIPPPSTLDCPLINLPEFSPGGVLDDLIMWMDAGQNVTFNGSNEVSQWQGQSANGFTLTNSAFGSAEGTPDYNSSAATSFNFNPFISFNNEGALNDFLGFTSFTNFPTDNLTFFIVLNTSNTTGTQTAVSYFDGTENDLNLDLVNTTNVVRQDISGTNTDGTSSIRDGLTRVVMTDYQEGINQGRVFVNNLLETTGVVNEGLLTQGGEFALGQDIDNSTDGGFNTSQAFIGEVAEVIMYFNDALTDTERQKISSYLAIKYGVTLDQSTNQDYVNSIGGAIYPTLSESATYGAYDNDIAGIGRDDGSNLSQEQSRSVNSDGILTGAKSSFSSDRQFLVWGNDNGTLAFSAVDIAADVTSRLQREWRASVENGITDVNLSFDFSSGVTGVPLSTENLVLLVDDDGTFASGTLQQVSVSSWDGSIAVFNDVTLTDEAVFTVAVLPESPGGVSTSLVAWLRADAGTSTTTDNTTLATWTDQSSLGNDATDDGNPPLYKDNATDNINFNPVIDFDGTDDRLTLQLNGLKGGSYALFAAGVREDAGVNFLLASDDAGPVNNEVLHFGYEAATGATFAQWNNDLDLGGLDAFDTPEQSPFILFGELDVTSGRVLQENRNSTLSSASDASLTPLAGTRTDYIGVRGNANYFNGRIGELLAYSGALTAAEEQKIYTYLAIKYGITLNSGNTDYLASNGNVVFAATSSLPNYTIFNNDIAGIGRDDLSSLNQLQSLSENTDAILTVSISSFTSNSSYLIWGNDNDDQGLGSTAGTIEEVSADLPTNILSRLDREWRVENTNSVNGNTIAFDLTGIAVTGTIAEDFTLMIDADGDFSNGFIQTIEAASFASNVVTFNNVDFADDDIFTLGTSRVSDAPGGVTSGIQLWVRGDREVVDNAGNLTWADQSGNNNDVIQSGGTSATGTTSVNTNNVIVVSDLDRTFTAGSLTGQSIIYAGAANTAGNGDFSGYVGFNGDTGIRQNINGENNFRNPGNTDDWSNGGTYYFNGTENNTTNIDGVGTFHIGVAERGSSITDDFYVGGYSDLNRFYTGDTQYGDVIIYNDVLTDTERVRIESYLAIKYGITLASGDYDYESSAGSIVFPGNSDSDFIPLRSDVGGIGRDDNSDFEQLTSQSANTSSVLSVTKNAAFNADNQFIVWANNGFAMATPSPADFPSGTESRLGRAWRVKLTNSPSGTIDMTFDLSSVTVGAASDLRILVDADGDFGNATILAPSVVQNGNNFTFSSINLSSFSDKDLFTIGTIDNADTPLPLNWISFEVREQGSDALLIWKTTNEENVSHFEVERSFNGTDFNVIGHVAANNTAGIHTYQFTDRNPSGEITYYRIRQVDYDGLFEYSKTSFLIAKGEIWKVDVYPNPVSNVLKVSTSLSTTGRLRVIDLAGAVHLDYPVGNGQESTLDVSGLSSGIYMVEFDSVLGLRRTKFIKQ